MKRRSDFILVSEAARIAGVSTDCIRRALESGKLDGCTTSGGVRLLERASVFAFADSRSERRSSSTSRERRAS